MRGPRTPDHVPGPVDTGRVHREEPDQAAAGGVPEGVGKAGHAGGVVQSPGHGRSQSERVDLGQSRARAGGRRSLRRHRPLPARPCDVRRRLAVAGRRAALTLND